MEVKEGAAGEPFEPPEPEVEREGVDVPAGLGASPVVVVSDSSPESICESPSSSTRRTEPDFAGRFNARSAESSSYRLSAMH